MKQSFCLFSLVIFVLSSGCKKESNRSFNNNSIGKIDSIMTYLQNKLPRDAKKLDLKTIKFLNYEDKNVAIQIFETSSNQKFLLLRKNQNSYTGSWVDLSNLSKSQSNYYQGYVTLRGINEGFAKKLIVDKNRVLKINQQGKDNSNSLSPYAQPPSSNNKFLKETLEEVQLPEIIVVAGRDAADYFNLDWLFQTGVGSNDLYIPMATPNFGGAGGAGGTGGSSSQNINLTALAVIDRPRNPVKNLKEELKCFTINLSSSYTVSVNVNQPNPNTRDKIDPSADFIVGHTFLTLEQKNSDGSKIVRNIGFYPNGSVWPGNSKDNAIFGEDSKTPYAVSLQISISGTELQSLIKTLFAEQSYNYDLNNHNCVNAAASALASIHVDLPLSKSGLQLLFSGNNPGDLGQDIRDLDLATFSKNNGNREIKRTVSNSNNQYPQSKEGTC